MPKEFIEQVRCVVGDTIERPDGYWVVEKVEQIESGRTETGHPWYVYRVNARPETILEKISREAKNES